MGAPKGNKYGVGNGRPTKYLKSYDKKAHELALLGCTKEQIAVSFDIATQTLYEWEKAHKSFHDAIKSGQEPADGKVASSLYQRAQGYDYVEETQELITNTVTGESSMKVVKRVTKKIPPDTGAAMAWLKNRQPKLWRDKQIVQIDDSNISSGIKSLAELINNPVKDRTIDSIENEEKNEQKNDTD